MATVSLAHSRVAVLTRPQAILLLMLAADRRLTREQLRHDAASLGEDDPDMLIEPLLAGGYARQFAEGEVELTPEGAAAGAALVGRRVRRRGGADGFHR
jgi:hypothetical protein